MKRNIALLALLALIAAGGCKTLSPTGPYAGDKVLYSADLTITTSYDVIHTFVTWEYQNRVALSGTPGIKAAADNMRKNAKQWIRAAIACRDAYASAPSDGNLDALKKALAVLSAAVTQATTVFNQQTTQ